MLVTHVYVVKEVVLLRGVGQLINVVYKRMHAQATDKLKECKTALILIAVCIKMIQEF